MSILAWIPSQQHRKRRRKRKICTLTLETWSPMTSFSLPTRLQVAWYACTHPTMKLKMWFS